MKVFAYADETEFTIQETSSCIVGSGIFITEQEINQSIIDDALFALKQDSERNEIDLRTLQKGYFHASHDSKNAHSHLCNAINENLNGYFKYSYHNQSTSNINLSKENLNRRTLELVATPLLDYKFDEITFIIEGRNDFSQKQCEIWIENLYRITEITLHNLTSFLTYFPKIEVKIADKSTPGLQVIDFLIWAQNRTKNHDQKWVNRLKVVNPSNHTIQDNPSFGGSFYLNKWIEFPIGRTRYPFHRLKDGDQNTIITSYLLMEQTVIMLNKHIDRLPESVKHHQHKIVATARALLKAKGDLSYELIENIASTYLRVFDTLPIYNGVKEDDKHTWELLLYSKHIAALLRKRGNQSNARTINLLAYWKLNNEESTYLEGLWPIQRFVESAIKKTFTTKLVNPPLPQANFSLPQASRLVARMPSSRHAGQQHANFTI